jgi:hypothetical protein
MRQSFYRVYESSLLKENSVVRCWFLKRRLFKKLFSFLTTKNRPFNNEQLTFSSAIATGEQHPCFVHPFGGRSTYCFAILLCLQPLSGRNKDDVHLFLHRTKISDIPKQPVLLAVNLVLFSLLVVRSYKCGC